MLPRGNVANCVLPILVASGAASVFSPYMPTRPTVRVRLIRGYFETKTFTQIWTLLSFGAKQLSTIRQRGT